MILMIPALILSTAAFSQDLRGLWTNMDDGSIIQFQSINGNYYQRSTQEFVDSYYGNLEYTIEQSVRIPVGQGSQMQGKVDFFDSRGCSFKDLSVLVEFENKNVVNVLMQVPRYKFQRITTGQRTYRPRYCEGRYGSYVCGREVVRPSTRVNCRLLEYVDVPVRLVR